MRTWVFGVVALLLMAAPVRAGESDKGHDISEVFNRLYSLTAWRWYETEDVYLRPGSISFHLKEKPELKITIFGLYWKAGKNIFYFDPERYEAPQSLNMQSGLIVCQFFKIRISPGYRISPVYMGGKDTLDLLIDTYETKKDQKTGKRRFCNGSGYHPKNP